MTRTKILFTLLLIVGAFSQCPGQFDIRNLQAGNNFTHVGIVEFEGSFQQQLSPIATSTYTHVFNRTFTSAPNIALGSTPLTQEFGNGTSMLVQAQSSVYSVWPSPQKI